jgi:hypothetical protein
MSIFIVAGQFRVCGLRHTAGRSGPRITTEWVTVRPGAMHPVCMNERRN